MSFIREHVVKTFTRSKGWKKTRKKFIKKNNICSCCGTKRKLEVHHIVPVHINKELELEVTNLVTLCRRCHFLIGHFCNWRSYNKYVLIDCMNFYNKIKTRP
jgi:hypothetical protein